MGERATIDQDYLHGAADAIRRKNGTSNEYTPTQFEAAIDAIPTGITPTGTINITANGQVDVTNYATANVSVTPNLQSKTATENGTVTPDSGYDGLSSVVVNVSGGGGSGLPSEYQQVEYVEFSGNQYFVWNTGSPNDKMLRVISSISEGHDEQCVVGNGDVANNRPEIYYAFLSLYFTQSAYSGVTNYASTFVTSSPVSVSVNTPYRVEAFYYSVHADVTTLNVGRYKAQSESNTYPFFGKIYALALFNSIVALETGLVSKLVPCYRKSDSVIGFYDIINSVFYINQGTGTFGKGPDVQ